MAMSNFSICFLAFFCLFCGSSAQLSDGVRAIIQEEVTRQLASIDREEMKQEIARQVREELRDYLNKEVYDKIKKIKKGKIRVI